MTVADEEEFEDNSDLVLRLDDVRREIAKLKEIEDELIAAIAAKVPEGDVTDGEGNVAAVVTQGRQFSADRARELLPESLLPLVEKTTIVAAKVKELLPQLNKLLPEGASPLDYEDFKAPYGKPKVKVVE